MISTQGRPGVSALVDATTLTLMATIVQTVVITLTLLVFIFQFRSQEKAIREASYQNLLGRYNDFMMTSDSADVAMLARLVPTVDAGPEDAAVIRRLMISYGIIEEAYELYRKGWIDKESWEQWNSWLKAISRHPHFPALHTATTGMFNKEFQDHVSNLLSSGSSDNASLS